MTRNTSCETLLAWPICMSPSSMLSFEEASIQKILENLELLSIGVDNVGEMHTYKLELSSMNLRQIWVLPMPPRLYRRNDFLWPLVLELK